MKWAGMPWLMGVSTCLAFGAGFGGRVFVSGEAGRGRATEAPVLTRLSAATEDAPAAESPGAGATPADCVELAAAIQKLIDSDLDHFQATRIRELIRELPISRHAELPGLLMDFGHEPWVERAIIEGWAMVDAKGVIEHLQSLSPAALDRWKSEIVRQWGRMDADAATRWILSQPLRAGLGDARVALVEVISETDPVRALDLLRETGMLHRDPDASGRLIRNWAARDPMAAWQAMQAMQEELTGRPWKSTDVSPQWARLSEAFFDGARLLPVSEMQTFLMALPPDVWLSASSAVTNSLLSTRPELLDSLIGPWSATEAGRSLLTQWAQEAPHEALLRLQSIVDPELRASLAASALQPYGNLLSVQLADYAARADAFPLLEAAMGELPAEAQAKTRLLLTQEMAGKAPELAMQLWSMLEKSEQLMAAPRFFHSLAEANPLAATAMFHGLPADDIRAAALPTFCFSLAASDPRRALTLSLEEPNQTRRTEATGLTLARWAAKETAAATMALREAAPFLDLPALIPVLGGAGSMRVGGKTIHYIVGHNGSALVPVVEQLIATSP